MNEEVVEKLEEVACLLRNEVLECIQEELEESIHNAIEDYCINHEDVWYRIKNRIKREVNEGVVADGKHELWMAFQDLRQETKCGTSTAELDRLGEKIDKLHQNMDALFMEIQSLKRRAFGPYGGE